MSDPLPSSRISVAAKPPPTLAVIIPHYNDPVRLGTCLAALAPQLAGRTDVECLVVDNDSPCDLGPLEAARPAIRFVTEARKGAAAARNRGVSETSAPALLFLDSDCVPAPDWLVTALGLYGRADVIGGRVDTFDETPPPRTGPEAFETVFAFHQKDYIEKKGFSVTANLLTSRAVFEDVGPLTVGLSEDIDWCWRAREKGYQLIYADELAVAHPTRSDWPGLTKKLRRTTDELFFLNGTSPSARMKWLARSMAVLLSGPVQITTVLASPRLSGAGERSRAAGTLLRLRAMRSFWMMRQALLGR
jgi:GT2 family glycosyltransferase